MCVNLHSYKAQSTNQNGKIKISPKHHWALSPPFLLQACNAAIYAFTYFYAFNGVINEIRRRECSFYLFRWIGFIHMYVCRLLVRHPKPWTMKSVIFKSQVEKCRIALELVFRQQSKYHTHSTNTLEIPIHISDSHNYHSALRPFVHWNGFFSFYSSLLRSVHLAFSRCISDEGRVFAGIIAATKLFNRPYKWKHSRKSCNKFLNNRYIIVIKIIQTEWKRDKNWKKYKYNTLT